MTFLNTGDNPHRNAEMLRHVGKILSKHGCRPVANVTDTTRKPYATLFKKKDEDIAFYVVARATSPFKGHIVSTQTSLLKRARTEELPLLMYVDGYFTVFWPRHCLDGELPENPRMEEDMKNFSMHGGVTWYPATPLSDVVERVKRKGPRFSKTGLDEYTDEK